MFVGVLGDVRAERDGADLPLGVRRHRELLAALVLSPRRSATGSALAGLLWGEAPPPGAHNTLQTYVAGLRRALQPDAVVVTTPQGYALDLPDDAVDAVRYERAVDAARRALGAAAHDPLAAPPADGPARAAAELAAARALWRGTPYAELGDAAAAVAERARLEELRLVAAELGAVVRLADGDHAALAADLERLTAEHPLREQLWALRAVALARAGRQADALAVLREVRTALSGELGIDPGPVLRRVEEAVLRQDPATSWTPTALPDPAPAPAAPPAGSPWELVGREAELARLTEVLAGAAAGRPSFASLIGEPGIGKSRLAAELAARAAAGGTRVLVGRCSQDEGAPPLWPWAAVLAGLPDVPAPEAAAEPGTDPQAERFRTWDAICRRLLAAAARQPLLVVLDDLHWADASSLRVLRHLVATAETGRLALVATWRPHPEPTGPLAEVAEALARRHALRLELAGLPAEDSARLVAAVAGTAPAGGTGELLHRRTDGNPFFLVEYARLVGEGGAVTGAELPAGVSDVLGRRLAGLPEPALAAVRAAAVLGREVRLPRLAALLGTDEDAVLDALDPALAAGLLTEDGVDRFRFAHALVRDAAYATLPLSRRARLHARAAEAAEDDPADPQATAEAARHWLAAGPAAAGRAWPAAVAAARAAMDVHAHEEARDLLVEALRVQRQDPAAGWRERYDTLLALAAAHRLTADWTGLSEASDEAVAVAEAAGDVERTARAAIGPSQGALWQPREYGAVHEPVVAALRRVLQALPPGDGELRCRAMTALASELYHAAAPLERDALTDEALAMARRLGDPELLHAVLMGAYQAVWRPATAEHRLALATEAQERAGTPAARATAATMRAVALFELGRLPERAEVAREARVLAEPLRLVYLLALLDTMEAPLLALSGRAEEAEVVLARAVERFERLTLPQAGDGIAGAVLTVRLFQDRLAEALPLVGGFLERASLPVTAVMAAVLLRSGMAEQARALLAGAPPIDLTADDWFAMLTWCSAGEVALGTGDAVLGAAAHARALPYAGRMCSGGSGAPLGPVDAFLALAAAAAGDRTAAGAHADRAEELCRTWQLPPVARWLRDQRERHGF
ncbi:BTAD domain-containing putative transcriptional regulator [Blastococcus sp. SYSU D00813]